MKVAVVGSGISGLAAAHRLRGQARVTLFEAGDYFGGHTHTVDVTLPNAQGQAVTDAAGDGDDEPARAAGADCPASKSSRPGATASLATGRRDASKLADSAANLHRRALAPQRQAAAQRE